MKRRRKVDQGLQERLFWNMTGVAGELQDGRVQLQGSRSQHGGKKDESFGGEKRGQRAHEPGARESGI